MATTAVVASPSGDVAGAGVRLVLRDIARGGLTGAIVGLVFGGIGGRLVMRLATLLVPDAAGGFTENGNRIGDITLGGSIGVVLAGGIVGLLASTMWVVIAPWLPWRGVGRAVAAVPIALALGTPGLIDGDNRDFFLLRHDQIVVASLVLLVAGIGFAFPIVDDWLDRRLPPADQGRRATTVFALLTAAGAILVLPISVLSMLGSTRPAIFWTGVALCVLGAVTVTWWFLRGRGHARPEGTLLVVGRAILLVVVVIGAMASIPHVLEAMAA